jgi:hypothetical protein
MSNITLYFKGLLARLVQFTGVTILTLGICLILYFAMANKFNIWIGIIITILGIPVLLYGNALRFKFKRESGYLVYGNKL